MRTDFTHDKQFLFRPYETLVIGATYFSTNMVLAYANNLWDCPVRDNILVESEIEVIIKSRRDDIFVNADIH